MVANGNSLLDLINSILDLAKIEAGRLQIERTPFDLIDLVEKTISTFSARAHTKGLELTARIAPDVPEQLKGDPLRLRQILINLLGNAIKFTPAGEIKLTVERDLASADPGALRFSITDTGSGIPADKIEALFGAFTQADSSTTRQYGGSGLGLAIVKRLVDLMGGRIWIESVAGAGSTFAFTVALEAAPKVIVPRPDTAPNLAGVNILVVDDNPTNRLIVREMLASRGAQVAEAESGPDALAMIRVANAAGRSYQIILIDMRMPGMDGLETSRLIRAEAGPTRLLILMLSSDDLKPQLARLRASGLDLYLVKPITRTELFAAIARLLEQVPSPDRGTAEPVLEAVSTTASALPPIAILLVDDSADNRLVIEAYLKREPCAIDYAENGEVAVAHFAARRYDVVLMDLHMPVMDGYAATKAIRAIEAERGVPRTPVVALTASVFEEAAREAAAAGCDAHVMKPIKKAALLDLIRKYSDRRSTPRDGSSAPLHEGMA